MLPRDPEPREGESPQDYLTRKLERIRQAAAKMRSRYRPTIFKDPHSRHYLYDAEEIEAIKAKHWIIVPAG